MEDKSKNEKYNRLVNLIEDIRIKQELLLRKVEDCNVQLTNLENNFTDISDELRLNTKQVEQNIIQAEDIKEAFHNVQWSKLDSVKELLDRHLNEVEDIKHYSDRMLSRFANKLNESVYNGLNNIASNTKRMERLSDKIDKSTKLILFRDRSAWEIITIIGGSFGLILVFIWLFVHF